ncbi:MAG: phosphatase PAP2 family protein [Novosphingobium sp.]|nr:phosphatase PAP2 family protein [Novosphingobium sp.]
MARTFAGSGRALVVALALAGCVGARADVASDAPPANEEQHDQRRSMLGTGYLEKAEVPDSMTLNPPPPAAGSGALARDEEGARDAVSLQGTPRFRLAKVDADIFTPDGQSVFSCSAGFVISEAATPKTNALLRKTLADLAFSTYPTKTHYQRKRPFMVNGQPTCTPDHQAMLEKDGSYPSGHSAIGYGWGLILAEVVPDKAAQLVARGRVFGDSRRVCNVHWLSDVEEGRVVATAVVARLHADPEFRSDLAAAREEIEQVRGSLPVPDCALEKAALGGGE